MGRLIEEGRRFMSKLPRSGIISILADNDTDGIIAAHLFAKYYHKKNPYTSIIINIMDREEIRKEVEECKNTTLVFLDLSPDRDSISLLGAKKIYVVDHHPVLVRAPNIIEFNPHLYNVPYASRYNTGFLVYLLFKDDIDRSGDLWKVAVSSFGDSSYDYLKPYFYGLDKRVIELASHMIGSIRKEMLGVLFSALEESKSIDDFVANEDLIKMKEEFEKTLLELLNEIDRYCYYCNERIKVVLLPERFARFKSAIATVYSKRNPDFLVCVGVKDREVYNFSLRYQNAQEKKVHLGTFASNLARKWNTHGGGHAPASGLRVPEDKLDEFLIEVKKLVP